MNLTELVNECVEMFGKSITQQWVDSFLIRHATEPCDTNSIPQENPRCEVPRDLLEMVIDVFLDHVHNTCVELVFNLGEIVISE
jgi:hypothetical protein